MFIFRLPVIWRLSHQFLPNATGAGVFSRVSQKGKHAPTYFPADGELRQLRCGCFIQQDTPT